MKLLSCHVEGFGKIRDKDFDFNSSITTFYEQNGYGKSTLASFIKAMFYGLESYKENTVEFLDRQHFYPFDGGAFGGNLTFESDGKVYKIERFFGEKSQTKDTVKLYVNGEETPVLTCLGKTFFGIDKQSFERTAFVDSNEIEVKSTSSINLNLNGFLQGGDLSLDYDSAIALLDKTAKQYKKSKKGKDEISEISNELNLITEKIANAKAVEFALEEKYERLKILKTKINELTKQISKAQSLNAELSAWEHLESVQNSINEASEEINDIKSRYKNGLPSDSEINKVSELLVKQRELLAKSENGLSEEENIKLQKLKTAFINGVPSKETINSVESDVLKYSSVCSNIESVEVASYSETDGEILKTFSLNPPSDVKISNLDSNVNLYKNYKQELDLKNDLSESKTSKNGSLAYGIFAVVSLILCVFGGLFIKEVYGVLTLIVGIVGLFFSGFLYLSKMNKVYVENPEKRKLQLKLTEVEDKIKATLIPYGYSSGNGILYDYATFIADLKRFTQLSDLINKSNQNRVELTSKKDALYNNLSKFFALYGLTGDNFISNLSRLQSGILEYESLNNRLSDISAKRGEFTKDIQNIEGYINAFKQKYGLSVLNVNAIVQDINTVKTQTEFIEQNLKKAQLIKQEKGLTVKPDGSAIDLKELNNSLSELQSTHSALSHEIYDDEFLTEKLDGYINDKNLLSIKLDECKTKHKLLLLSIDYLSKAEQNLKDKYVKPVKDEFVKYAELLEKTLGEKITMTKNFEVRFERNGKERSDKHLSSGIKSICAFCFRIAIIKNMYKNKSPFLILDDPFVNLDEEHLDKVALVLKELSKDMQIIYFTCHKSRIL